MRRDTAANLAAVVVQAGEWAYATDTGAMKFGDGSTAFASLSAVGAGGGEAFPVGSVFTAVVSTNPATLLGYGTWAAMAAGRVLVGLNSGDTDFDVVEETGGAKTVASAGTNSTPTFTGNALGTHTHSVTSNVSVDDHAAHTHTAGTLAADAHSGSAASGGAGTKFSSPVTHTITGSTGNPSATLTHTVNNNAVTSGTASGGTPTGSVSAPTFTGSATSVVQPYFVVYFWKRTA